EPSEASPSGRKTRSRSGGRKRESGGKAGGCWWDTVRARLVRGGGFTECTATDVLARLEWAAEQEEDDGDGDGGVTDEGGAAVSAMATGDNDGGGGGQAGQGNVGGTGKRRRRMRRHLDAVKVLCEEWGLLGAGGACAAASSGGGASSGSGNGGGVGSWSGWEAFGLAIATSASRDRL
ncbi:unnamed protein product, partial [Ectocarpus sp. 12 AP-2014]